AQFIQMRFVHTGWGAHACSVLVAAFCGDELGPERRLFTAVPTMLDPFTEVREGRMPSPARTMRALPRVVDRHLTKIQMRRAQRSKLQLPSRMQPSTRPSNKLSEPGALVEVRMLRAHRE